MRTRMMALLLSVALGFPLVAALTLLCFHRESESAAAIREIRYPPALSPLGTNAFDIALDSQGILWIPILDSATGKLYRYDPASDSLEFFLLPAESGSTPEVRIAVGEGAREGQLVIGWGWSLFEVDAATGAATKLPVPFDVAKLPKDPLGTGIIDLAVDPAGAVWVTSYSYPYLVAVEPDGSLREFKLPDEAGKPEQVAVDGQGRAWATITGASTMTGPDGKPMKVSGQLTLRFDPRLERFDIIPSASWFIAAAGEHVVAVGGTGPGVAREFAADSAVALAADSVADRSGPDFAPTSPVDPVAVGADGSVWYGSLGLRVVHISPAGDVEFFPLPLHTGDLRDTGCPAPPENCQGPFTTGTTVTGIAVASDGSACVSVGGRIGHAVP